jgi:hypothetical protein
MGTVLSVYEHQVTRLSTVCLCKEIMRERVTALVCLRFLYGLARGVRRPFLTASNQPFAVTQS